VYDVEYSVVSVEVSNVGLYVRQSLYAIHNMKQVQESDNNNTIAQ